MLRLQHLKYFSIVSLLISGPEKELNRNIIYNKDCLPSFVLKVLQNILETETEYSKDLQSLLTIYLRPLQNTDKYVSLTPKLLSNRNKERTLLKEQILFKLLCFLYFTQYFSSVLTYAGFFLSG